MVMGKLSTDSLAIAAKNAAHAIVRNHRLLTSVEFWIRRNEYIWQIKNKNFVLYVVRQN